MRSGIGMEQNNLDEEEHTVPELEDSETGVGRLGDALGGASSAVL